MFLFTIFVHAILTGEIGFEENSKATKGVKQEENGEEGG